MRSKVNPFGMKLIKAFGNSPHQISAGSPFLGRRAEGPCPIGCSLQAIAGRLSDRLRSAIMTWSVRPWPQVVDSTGLETAGHGDALQSAEGLTFFSQNRGDGLRRGFWMLSNL